MPNGTQVCNITLATTDKWRDKTTGDPQERTEWHKIIFFNKLAEIVAEYVKKGSKIYVEGRNQTRSYDQDGVKRYVTEVVGSKMIMLDKKSESAPAPQKPDYKAAAAGDPARPAPGSFGDYDDDIAF